MSNTNKDYPIESSELIEKIKKLGFVGKPKIETMTGVSAKTFNNTLFYQKETGEYIARVNLKGHSYKVSIPINGNRPNPRYEKQLKRCFKV